MLYENLNKLYYKNQNEYDEQYKLRFNSPFTKHFELTIKECNRRKEYEIFYCPTEEIVLLYDKITLLMPKFQKLLQNIPKVGIKQFCDSCLIDEIKASNDIEGVASTRKEIITALKTTPTERINVRLGSIINKYAAIIENKSINLTTCYDIRRLYDEFLIGEINQTDLPDGQIFRAESVDIVTPTQKTIHQGVYPESKIIQYMNEALKILHDKNIPTLIRLAIFHYLFGYIHPFYDGNGRMSRFITSYFLAKHIDSTIALQLSVLLKTHRKLYYEMFEKTNSEINKGDLTPFIIDTLQLIYNAIEHTKKILENKLSKYHSLQKKLTALNLKDNTLLGVYDILLQASIFSTIGATSSEIQMTLKKSENTIKTKMKMIPVEYIIRDTQTRPYHYKLNLEKLK